jgi:hypothetical protein
MNLHIWRLFAITCHAEPFRHRLFRRGQGAHGRSLQTGGAGAGTELRKANRQQGCRRQRHCRRPEEGIESGTAFDIAVITPAVVDDLAGAGKIAPIRRQRRSTSSETFRIDNETLIFALLAVVLSIAAGIGSIVAVHFLIFLQARGVDFALAVTLGTFFDPRRSERASLSACSVPLPPDLDYDRVLHAHGHRSVAAIWRDTRARACDSTLWRGLRNFLDRTRDAALGVVRPCPVSAIDGQTGVSKPDRPGARAFSWCADRSKWIGCDRRRIDAAGADQCVADRCALVALPEER